MIYINGDIISVVKDLLDTYGTETDPVRIYFLLLGKTAKEFVQLVSSNKSLELSLQASNFFVDCPESLPDLLNLLIGISSNPWDSPFNSNRNLGVPSIVVVYGFMHAARRPFTASSITQLIHTLESCVPHETTKSFILAGNLNLNKEIPISDGDLENSALTIRAALSRWCQTIRFT